jgi:hypothetical protein
MTVTVTEGPLTVRGVLFPAGTTELSENVVRGLRATVTTIDWTRLGSEAVGAVRMDFVGAFLSLLDGNLGDLLLAGWRTYAALTDAAQRTLVTGVPETVVLATHRVEHRAEPYVEVVRDGVEIARVTCTVTAGIEVTAVAARVQLGRLVALLSGEAAFRISLQLLGHTYEPAEPCQISLPIDLALGGGVQLVDPVTVVRARG